MKTKFLAEEFVYDGSQLSPLWNYLSWGLLGDSMVAFVGPCDISNLHMADGEDLLQGQKICGSRMLHFIAEIYDQDLMSGVLLQRILASLAKDILESQLLSDQKLRRSGDDLYFADKKLSISVAAPATRSILVHFALNISNQGTPVATCSLEDFRINPISFAENLLKKASEEWQDSKAATWKVKEV